MDYHNQGSASAIPTSQIVPRRRGHGRPRKSDRPAPVERIPANPNTNTTTRGDQAPSGGRDAGGDAAGSSVVVGQIVQGVIDYKFDAGYMVSVGIGDEVLRGVLYFPASPETKAYPHVPPVTPTQTQDHVDQKPPIKTEPVKLEPQFQDHVNQNPLIKIEPVEVKPVKSEPNFDMTQAVETKPWETSETKIFPVRTECKREE